MVSGKTAAWIWERCLQKLHEQYWTQTEKVAEIKLFLIQNWRLHIWIWNLSLAFLFLEYPHKYGPQGGCADHSVFERMQKYQMTGIEEPTTEV